jgi:hypothetical protein
LVTHTAFILSNNDININNHDTVYFHVIVHQVLVHSNSAYLSVKRVVNRYVVFFEVLEKVLSRFISVGGWIFRLIFEELWFSSIYEMQSIEEFWGVRNWGIDGSASVVGSLA